MRPWLSEGLAADLLVARMAQADFQRDHPDEKPPLVEGPLFNASAYEPYTAYAIEPLLRLWEELPGGELNFPPDYPKMPGEPPRVQPSKKNADNWEADGVTRKEK